MADKKQDTDTMRTGGGDTGSGFGRLKVVSKFVEIFTLRKKSDADERKRADEARKKPEDDS